MVSRLVFASSFEALSRALGDQLNPAVRAEFRKLGVDYDRGLPTSLPLEVWGKSMRLAGALLFPSHNAHEQLFRLGRRMMDSYGETLVGRVLLAMTRAVGPRRTLERAARNLRTANNYTEIRLERLADTRYQLHFNFVSSSELYRGLLQRGLEISGARHVESLIASQDGDKVTLSVSWE